MKLSSKLILYLYIASTLTVAISINSFARDVVVITYKNADDRSVAEDVRNIFLTKTYLPKNLIRVQKQEVACKKITTAILQCCIENDEIFFPVINEKIIKNSFQAFAPSMI